MDAVFDLTPRARTAAVLCCARCLGVPSFFALPTCSRVRGSILFSSLVGLSTTSRYAATTATRAGPSRCMEAVAGWLCAHGRVCACARAHLPLMLLFGRAARWRDNGGVFARRAALLARARDPEPVRACTRCASCSSYLLAVWCSLLTHACGASWTRTTRGQYDERRDDDAMRDDSDTRGLAVR